MNTSEKLKIALIQTDIIWENPTKNKLNLEKKINTISSNIDLIILPEMFTTGFTMDAKNLAESMNGKTVLWMQKIALKKQAAITGTIIISDNSIFYNRLLFIHPSGKVDFYDKRHTFTLAKEENTYTAGKDKLIVNYKNWKICPLICYDLRFPIWSRNSEDYDLLLYVANWPKPRINAWNALLKARAIENMSYTIGVNRIGIDGKGYEYTGNSICYDTLGNSVTELETSIEKILILELDKKKQNELRNHFRFLNDRDSYIIK